MGGMTPKASAVRKTMFFGMSPCATGEMIRDVADRIAGPGVLGQAVVVEVHPSMHRIEHHILQHGSERLRRHVDLGLGVGPKPNDLGVTSPFEIEHATLTPAVLIVSDELPRGIGRQRGFPRAREAEEDRGITRGADIGRAVHRHHMSSGHEVVERGENRLLHFACVSRAPDQHELLAEIDRNEGARSRAVTCGIGLKVRGVQDGEARAEVGQLRRKRANEHVVDEERMPGIGRDEADRQPKGWIGTGEKILDEYLTRIEISADIVVQALERGRLETGSLLPPDPVCRAGLLGDELVLG